MTRTKTEDDRMSVALAAKLMRDWPKGRVRRAVKIGAPHDKRGVVPSELRAWAKEREDALAITPADTEPTLNGYVVAPDAVPLEELFLAAGDRATIGWSEHECMAWATPRSRGAPKHYRVQTKGKSLLVRCGKCLEVRLRVSILKAWPVTLRVPEATK